MTEPRASLQKALAQLSEGRQTFSRRLLQEFSDLDSVGLQVISEAWPGIQSEPKRKLLDALRDLSDEDTLVSFDDLARLLLDDPDGVIRTRAIRLLDESQDPKLVPAFIKIVIEDGDSETRAEAAVALGRYVELGELEEIPGSMQRQVEDTLLRIANGDDGIIIRRNALESLGYSARPEVLTLIESAFRRENPEWQASALTAMGRSSDERWEEHVLSQLMEADPAVRLAAVEAAGELRLASARQLLFEVLEDEDEGEISTAAIWSLSQIGGEDARVYIQNLLDLAEEEEHLEFLEQALENLEFTDELNRFDLMSINSDQE